MTLIAAPTRVPMAEGLKRGGLLHPVAIHPKPHRGQSTVEACKRVTQLNPPCNGVLMLVAPQRGRRNVPR